MIYKKLCKGKIIITTEVNTKELNLQWISDVIGDDYITKWKAGDYVLISSQTGTGKTSFIKNKVTNRSGNNLLIMNRTNLKRATKKDLLIKENMPIPETLKELDAITRIGNSAVISYHAIDETGLNEDYKLGKCDISKFDIVVADEAHFIFTDASFNNLTRIAYRELIEKHYPNSIIIFMSATLDEVEKAIEEQIDNLDISERPTIHKYSTGIDYSYVDVKYFKNIDDIVTLIKNDESADKWLLFVTNITEGKRLQASLCDISTLIHSKTKSSEELKSIIRNEKFEKKVLITTKTLDNGVSIHDEDLKHIVIMAWDRTTFIQELGRKRVDINNAQNVYLYIPMRYKKSFTSKLEQQYIPKREQVDLWVKDLEKFRREYNNKTDKIHQDLFYLNEETNEWTINRIGLQRLESDIAFAAYMVVSFKIFREYAFVKEQLSWIGLLHTFSESNLIENVIPKEVKETLESYLSKVEGKKLFAKEQDELNNLIMSELVLKKLDYRTKKMQPSTLEKILREELNLKYRIVNKRELKRKSNHYKEYYWKLVKSA